ncbi:SecY-interacting protein [uncultured Paraglaciecola sp.]|uniref:SecY-interacting protein n=1 Tax=uncultured Paraglaciecola sp. TaxID=1765024 RepID=UPI002608B19B|nr:SecY-interacting protein [uncultured Paraglaciecola sp.]
MSEAVTLALKEFVHKYVTTAQQHPAMLTLEYDDEWPSDCYTSTGKLGDKVSWQPVKRHQTANFNDLENALEMTIHKDVVSYFSSYWSDNLNAETSNGNLQLLQPWNQQDFERLQQNLVGHILMKRRLKQPDTLFFALTDEDDFILTVDNISGEVMLEQVGLVPKEVVAPNLAVFIQSLQPSTVQF